MKTLVYNSVTQVIKFIDPIEVPAYRMKMVYQQVDVKYNGLKPSVGPLAKLYANAKTN
tara:strand:+ start:626 stop:799 length:174 start_codon:yes stop_codon:yes gene_type:complete